MQLTDLRRWHWIIIAALVGLLIGYTINAIGLDGVITGPRSSKISQTQFEQELLNWRGQFPPLTLANGTTGPRISDLVVYPDGPVNLVKMQRAINLDPKSGDASTKWKYEKWFYEARRPYSPIFEHDATDVRVKPGFPAVNYSTDQAWDDAGAKDPTARDPGDGVLLLLSIAKGNYDIVIKLDDPKQAGDLIVKFNDHPLAPFTVDPADPQFVRSTIPVADFGADQARALSLARKDTPIHIHQIHVYNPTYAIRDYLNEMAVTHPDIHYRYAWWAEPKAVLWLSIGMSVLVIGIIWPTVIGVLVGAGFGPPPREKGASLRGLKATPAPVPVAKAATAEDLASLEQMEEELLKNLEADGSETPAEVVSGAPAGPAPVRVLNAKPINAPAPPKKEETPKSFAGEFYPVARKTGDEKKT